MNYEIGTRLDSIHARLTEIVQLLAAIHEQNTKNLEQQEEQTGAKKK